MPDEEDDDDRNAVIRGDADGLLGVEDLLVDVGEERFGVENNVVATADGDEVEVMAVEDWIGENGQCDDFFWLGTIQRFMLLVILFIFGTMIILLLMAMILLMGPAPPQMSISGPRTRPGEGGVVTCHNMSPSLSAISAIWLSW